MAKLAGLPAISSATDLTWKQRENMRIWRDLNQDGISQANELTALSTNRITAIGVDFKLNAFSNPIRGDVTWPALPVYSFGYGPDMLMPPGHQPHGSSASQPS